MYLLNRCRLLAFVRAYQAKEEDRKPPLKLHYAVENKVKVIMETMLGNVSDGMSLSLEPGTDSVSNM